MVVDDLFSMDTCKCVQTQFNYFSWHLIIILLPCFRGILLAEEQRYSEAVKSYQHAIHFRPRLAGERACGTIITIITIGTSLSSSCLNNRVKCVEPHVMDFCKISSWKWLIDTYVC